MTKCLIERLITYFYYLTDDYVVHLLSVQQVSSRVGPVTFPIPPLFFNFGVSWIF